MGKFTKQIIISILILLIYSIVEGQNVGIGTTNPQTKLQVAGALGFVADSAAAADADTIPDNVSVFRITYTSGGSRTGLIVLHPKEGQLLTIYDEDDNDAIFAGQIIPASGGIAYFMYLDGAWQLVSTNPITGPTGPAGTAGSNGTNGTNGATGATGPTGAVGATGSAGTNGSNGSNGSNGATGSTGAAGSTGPAGTNGSNGTSGFNGATGATGPTGSAESANAWGLTGNTGTGAATNFIGTIDDNPWLMKTNNVERARIASYGDFVIGSGDSSSTVTGGTLRAPSVWGGATGQSNGAGANLTITSGNGTGTGGSVYISFQTAPAAASSMTINTMAERIRVTNTGALAFGGATNYGTGSTGVGSILVSSGNATPAWSTATYPSGTTTAIPINTLLYASAANVISPLSAATTSGMILTNSSGTPTWTTATYPANTTINQILFSSGANVVTGITAGTTNQVLTSNGSGVPGWSSTLSVPAAASVGTVLTVGNRVSAKAFNGNTRQILASNAGPVQLDSTDFFVFVTFVSGDATNNTITLPNPAADYVGHLIIIRQSKNSSGKVKIASFSGSQISQLSDNDDTNLVSSLTDSDNRGSDMFVLGNSASGGLVWYEIGQSNTPW